VNVVHLSSITFKRERNRGFLIKLAIVSTVACSPRTRDAADVGPNPEANQVLFEGVRIDRFEKDRLRTRARIRSARLDRESGHVTGGSVEAEVYDETSALEARVTSPRMVSDLRSHVVRLEEGVVITDRVGRTLRTETIQYDSSADRLETSAKVEIDGDNFHAKGGRMTGQPRAGLLELEGPTTSSLSGR
jgi:LPS export ABC transporter protein LptC